MLLPLLMLLVVVVVVAEDEYWMEKERCEPDVEYWAIRPGLVDSYRSSDEGIWIPSRQGQRVSRNLLNPEKKMIER